MAIKRIVGGNTKRLKVISGARSSIKEQQKSQLKDYKYDLQAKVRQDVSGPHVGAVASRGRLSSFKITARNTSKTKKVTGPIKQKSGGIKKRKKKK